MVARSLTLGRTPEFTRTEKNTHDARAERIVGHLQGLAHAVDPVAAGRVGDDRRASLVNRDALQAYAAPTAPVPSTPEPAATTLRVTRGLTVEDVEALQAPEGVTVRADVSPAVRADLEGLGGALYLAGACDADVPLAAVVRLVLTRGVRSLIETNPADATLDELAALGPQKGASVSAKVSRALLEDLREVGRHFDEAGLSVSWGGGKAPVASLIRVALVRGLGLVRASLTARPPFGAGAPRTDGAPAVGGTAAVELLREGVRLLERDEAEVGRL